MFVAVLLHHFFQSDGVEQLAVELCVEGVAVILEALFQHVLRAEELEQFYESLIVAGIEEDLVFTDVEPCIGNMVQDLGNEVGGDFLVEKVGFFGGQHTIIEFLKALDKLFIGVEKALELLAVKDEVFVNVGNNQLLQLDVLVGVALAEVVKQEFL